MSVHTTIARVTGFRLTAAGAVALAAVCWTCLAPTAHGAAGTQSPPGYDPTACGGATTPTAHDPIVIPTNADWTAANGVTGGSGTAADPYVISCWSISVPSGHTAISIGTFDATSTDKAYVIRDVVLTASGGVKGNGSKGVNLATSTQATIEDVTATGLDYGFYTDAVGQLAIQHNLLTGTLTDGMRDISSPDLAITGNLGTGSGASCINRSATSPTDRVTVTGNECDGGQADGFLLLAAGDARDPHLVATGNTAQDNAGRGFYLQGGVSASGNKVYGNGYGFVVNQSNAVTGNDIGGPTGQEGNRQDGIEITAAQGSVIEGNRIVGNGSMAIQADPANTVSGFWGWANVIRGNHIGGSPVGIGFAGVNAGNVVSDTDWLDGEQRIVDFADQNTIVDAGSDKATVSGGRIVFDDYYARITFEDTPSTPGLNKPSPTRLAVLQSITWDFGFDCSGPGEQRTVTLTDPAQGHGVVPKVTCTYGGAKPGTYPARLTVTGLDSSQQPVTLTDTVKVTIERALGGTK